MIAMLAVGATQVTHLPSRKNDWTHMSCAVRHRLALECLMNWLLLRCMPLMASFLSPWAESDDGQMMGKCSSCLTGCELAELQGLRAVAHAGISSQYSMQPEPSAASGNTASPASLLCLP